MEHYIKRGFFYLELGDGEELWENRCMDRIVHYHETVYEMFCLSAKPECAVPHLWKPQYGAEKNPAGGDYIR